MPILLKLFQKVEEEGAHYLILEPSLSLIPKPDENIRKNYRQIYMCVCVCVCVLVIYILYNYILVHIVCVCIYIYIYNEML